MKRKPIILKLDLNADQGELLELFRRHNGKRTNGSAAKLAFRYGLLDFYGTNTDNPDFPELDGIDHDKL